MAIEWKFNGGRLNAPKIQSYGDAFEPVAKRIDRMADLERRQKEIDDGRAFQTQREEWKNLKQEEASALSNQRAVDAEEKRQKILYNRNQKEDKLKNAQALYGAEVDTVKARNDLVFKQFGYNVDMRGLELEEERIKDKRKVDASTIERNRAQAAKANRVDKSKSYYGPDFSTFNRFNDTVGVQTKLSVNTKAESKLYKDKYKKPIEEASARMGIVDPDIANKWNNDKYSREDIMSNYADKKESEAAALYSKQNNGKKMKPWNEYTKKAIGKSFSKQMEVVNNSTATAKRLAREYSNERAKIPKVSKNIEVHGKELNPKATYEALAKRAKEETRAGNGNSGYVKQLHSIMEKMSTAELNKETAKHKANGESAKGKAKREEDKDTTAIKLIKNDIDPVDFRKTRKSL